MHNPQSNEDVTAPELPVAAQVATPEENAEAREAFKAAHLDLLQTSRTLYYGMFVTKMRLSWDNPRVPTAGVNITTKVNLYINSLFWLKMTHEQRRDILIHEVDHILYLHPVRTSSSVGSNPQLARVMNVAQDVHINEPLTSLHEFGCTVKKLNEDIAKKGKSIRLEHGDHTEVHFEKLREAFKEELKEGKGDGMGDTIDDHNIWGEGEMNETLARTVVQEAANRTASQVGAGNIPQNVQQALSALNKSKVNWKQQLRHFFVNSIRYDKTSARSRRNRRYGLLQPGKKKDQRLHVAVCLDSSGSVGNDQFCQFFAEMDKIHDMGIQLTVIDADADVQAVYAYKKGTPPERHGGGGTYYQPAIAKALELEVDGILYFGDMDAADTPSDPKVPFLWVSVNSNQKPPAEFGKIIYVETEEK